MKRTRTVLAYVLCALLMAIAMAVCAGCAPQSPTDPSSSSGTASASEENSGKPAGSPSGASSASSGSDTVSTQFTDIPDTSSGAASGNSDAKAALEKQLIGDIKPIVKGSGMDIGAYVYDFETGACASVGGDTRMMAASMIKLAIAASFLELAETNKVSLDDVYTLEDSDIVGGTGSLGGRGAGATVTYGEMLDLMIAESDNTAANILIDEMGMDAVNDTIKRLGLTSTKLNRLMMDEEAIANGIENYTSARDVAAILELAYEGKLVSRKASKTLLSALRSQFDDEGIQTGLPESARFAHKTGALPAARHDGGIVEDDRDFIVVVMCAGDGFNLDGALDAMAAIGEATYCDIEGECSVGK